MIDIERELRYYKTLSFQESFYEVQMGNPCVIWLFVPFVIKQKTGDVLRSEF